MVLRDGQFDKSSTWGVGFSQLDKKMLRDGQFDKSESLTWGFGFSSLLPLRSDCILVGQQFSLTSGCGETLCEMYCGIGGFDWLRKG